MDDSAVQEMRERLNDARAEIEELKQKLSTAD